VAGAAEEPVVGDPELLHGVGQLGDPVLPEGVSAVGSDVRELGHQDLALLAQGAGHQRDLGAAGDVARHRGALPDRLVVGVRVHEHQPLVHAHMLFAAEVPFDPARRLRQLERRGGRRVHRGCVVQPAVVLLEQRLDERRGGRR
jgi:hypothetical protein